MGVLGSLGCSRQEFLRAVRDTTSIAQLLRLLGRARVGTNYTLVRKILQEEGTDTSHWDRNPASVAKLPLEVVLTKDSPHKITSKRKRLLISEGLLKERCSLCSLGPQWEGNPLTLRLDHINGIRNDNRLGNLRLLCPNCDSQTPTYCGRNKRRGEAFVWTCLDCSSPVSKGSTRCRRCSALMQKSKADWPSDEDLVKQVKKSSYRQVGIALGVSGNAVKKRLRVRGLLKHCSRDRVAEGGGL